MAIEITLLQDIKFALWVLISIVGVGTVATVIRAVAVSYSSLKKVLDNQFSHMASAMYDNSELSELIKFCHTHLKKKPEDAYAFWFLGKAHYKMNELSKAEEYFTKAIEIYPSWEKEWVRPFMVQIEAKRNTPLTNHSSGTLNSAP